MTFARALEVYLLLFVDSFVGSMVLPLSRVTAFKLMCYFGGGNTALAIGITTIGAVTGGMMNWFFGRLISLARKGLHKTAGTKVLHPYVMYAVLLSLTFTAWVHIVGQLINVLCGYLGIRPSYTCAAVFISYCLYLIYFAIANHCI